MGISVARHAAPSVDDCCRARGVATPGGGSASFFIMIALGFYLRTKLTEPAQVKGVQTVIMYDTLWLLT